MPDFLDSPTVTSLVNGVSVTASGATQKTANLSDVANAGTALANLGGAPLFDVLAVSNTTTGLTAKKVQPFNAYAGPITATALPALSGLTFGATYGVQKQDNTNNSVVVPFTSGDTTDGGATQITLTIPGTVYLQVVSNPAGGKFWKVINHDRSDTTLTTYLLGAQAISNSQDYHATIARTAQKFLSQCQGLAVGLGADGTTYTLFHGIGSARYTAYDLANTGASNPGGFSLHQLNTIRCVIPADGLVASDASCVYAGTWVTSATGQAVYGGQYHYSITAGSTVTLTSPTNTTAIGIRTTVASNGGLATVSIDGSLTAANLLPTAQQLVNAGYYASTILTTGGGSILPTTRCIDTYATGGSIADYSVPFADGLTAGVHTTVITVQGIFHAGGSVGRVYFCGHTNTTTTTAFTDATFEPTIATSLNTGSSAYEYAINILSPGAGTATFCGNVHGYDSEDTLNVYLDGSSVASTFTAGQNRIPTASVDIVRTSHVVDPANTAITIIKSVVNYHLDRQGLRIDVNLIWQLPGYQVQTAYMMMPMNGANLTGGPTNWPTCVPRSLMGKGTLMAAPGPIVFPGSTDLYYGRSKSAGGWVWDAFGLNPAVQGSYGCAFWVQDVLGYTNSWLNAQAPAGVAAHSSLTAVEDRAGTNTKIYVARVSSDSLTFENPIQGTQWLYSGRYVSAFYANGGADTALATF